MAVPLSLVPPRNPAGPAKDRRWTLIRQEGPITRHETLPGTDQFTDLDDVAAAAADILGYGSEWERIDKTGGFTAPAPEEALQ